MSTKNSVLASQARASLKGRWLLGVKVTLIIFLIGLILRFIPILGGIAGFIIQGPITLGLAIFYLLLTRPGGENVRLENMFQGFNTWWRAFKAYVLMIIYLLFWYLLLIIPGIIYSLAFSQAFFILADNKEIRVRDAFYKSRMMMKGYKWKFFLLQLRFLGWAILCIFTFGVGFLWLIPYMYATSAKFYDDIKSDTTSIISEASPSLVEAKV